MSAFFECGPFSTTDGEGRVLFENASISLADGQCVTLEGPSGSGKSTLLRQITALALASEAHRRLGGTEFASAELPGWRARVTLVAQDAPMISGSVRDNLGFPLAQKAGHDRGFDEEEAIQSLTGVGLGRLRLERQVRTLSGGERHRLALVRGLLWDPPVLVADEPLSGLDPDVAGRCFDLLLQYARRPGRLLLCALHDPRLNARADRRFRLEDGSLGESG